MKKNNYALDEEEKEILAAFDECKLKTVENFAANKREVTEIAKHSQALRKTKTVNIRITEQTLAGIKHAAAEEGLPYQTLIGSILHKYVRARLRDR